jgi:hypothetical protein
MTPFCLEAGKLEPHLGADSERVIGLDLEACTRDVDHYHDVGDRARVAKGGGEIDHSPLRLAAI